MMAGFRVRMTLMLCVFFAVLVLCVTCLGRFSYILSMLTTDQLELRPIILNESLLAFWQPRILKETQQANQSIYLNSSTEILEILEIPALSQDSTSTSSQNVNLTNSSNSTQRPDRKVFYFAVTHASTIDKRIDASLQTWCARVLAYTGRKVIWYSNAPDPRVDHVISIDGTDSYANITWRMIATWKHVEQNYPGFSWYSRFWDDNYVIPETFEGISMPDENMPLEIGRLAVVGSGKLVSIGTELSTSLVAPLYIDGGAGSLLSKSALKLMIGGMDQCESWLLESAQQEFSCAHGCEDLLFGICSARFFGIKHQRALGMFHTSPPNLPVFCCFGPEFSSGE